MKSCFYFFKLFENFLKRGKELPFSGVRKEKEVFYLNNFYDLLYEKENTIQKQGLDPPEYFEREKYYTMGPGIDFPMIMTYKDTENPNFEPYYYFLNGHNDVVYFADSNFTEDQTESYEYNPWGVLLTQADKNNLLYTAREFDFDIGLQFNRMRYYNANLGRFCQKDLISLVSNGFSYVLNNPVIYYDPFGLYGRWVQLKLPPPGGWAWEEPSCDNPISSSNCQELCLTISFCEDCCRTLYDGRWDDPGFEQCLKGCKVRVSID